MLKPAFSIRQLVGDKETMPGVEEEEESTGGGGGVLLYIIAWSASTIQCAKSAAAAAAAASAAFWSGERPDDCATGKVRAPTLKRGGKSAKK